MKLTLSLLAACMMLADANPALAQPHGDPHARGMQRHARYFRPPARYHDAHHYYEGERWHGHPLVYRNGRWGYVNPGGLFIHISL